MKPAVEAAIAALRTRYPNRVEHESLSDGGAKVTVAELSLTDGPYEQTDTWCSFTITFLHPYADIYPLFVRPDLRRKDGRALGDAINLGRDFYGKPAIMLSRKTKLVGPEYPMDAALKVEKVIQWLISR